MKENSSPAPPVILTWQYFGSSQERGAFKEHTNDNTFTSKERALYVFSVEAAKRTLHVCVRFTYGYHLYFLE